MKLYLSESDRRQTLKQRVPVYTAFELHRCVDDGLCIRIGKLLVEPLDDDGAALHDTRVI